MLVTCLRETNEETKLLIFEHDNSLYGSTTPPPSTSM